MVHNQTNPSPEYNAVITLNEPYRLQCVSDDLCELFGFAPEQLQGRSLRMLLGPRTNTERLDAAVKSAGLRCTSTVPLIAYRCDSSEQFQLLTCAPHLSNDGEVEGISLTFRPNLRITHPSRSADFNTEPDVCETVSSKPNVSFRRNQNRTETARARAQHNRSTGQELEEEESSRNALAGPASGRRVCEVAGAGLCDEDEVFTLLLRSVAGD